MVTFPSLINFWIQYRRPPPIAHPGAQPSNAAVVAVRNSTTAQVGGEIVISIVSDATTSTNQATTSQAYNTYTAQSRQGFPPDAPTPLPTHSSQASSSSRNPLDKVKAQMQDRLKLKGARPSNEVEKWRFEVTWKPQQGALGVMLPPVGVVGDGLEIVRISLF
jgi:hypothetical protein